jgi:DNA-binding XRE family transcriptional regulator
MVWSEKHRIWADPDTRTPERRAKDETIARSAEADRERLLEALRKADAAQALQTEALGRAAEAQALSLRHDLVEARKKAGLTQSDVARRMDLPPSAIARLESGAHSPTLTTLTRYAAAIGAILQVRKPA